MKKIADIFRTAAGGTPLKSNKAFYEGGDIPWLLSGEVGGNITKTKNFITQAGLDGSSAKIFPVNTVLIAMYGATAGEVGILRCEAATNQAVCGIYPNENISPEYLYYFFLNHKDQLVAQAVGNAQPNISQQKIKDTEIDLPCISVQKRLVAILDEVFADIEQVRAKTEQNLKNARELFESYLQQVFSQRGDGWVKKTLAEVSLDFGRGRSRHRPRNDETLYGGDYPLIQTGDVRNCEHIITNFTKTYNEKGLAQSKIWPKGTICITIAANIAETGILGFDSCFPDSVIGVVVNPEITTVNYVEYLLQSFKVVLKEKGKGAAQDNINMGTFENMKFPFPLLETQNTIVDSLSKLMVYVQQLEKIYLDKLAAIDELKKAILQKAFSGELTQKNNQGAVA